MHKRPVDVVVVSDIHLGTYASKATEFIEYLQSIEPRLLILNGDIIDGWQFSKHYFPAKHIQVIQEIFQLLSKDARVIYITGNHDGALRKYSDLSLGNFLLTDKAVIEIDGKKNWIFHGDIFDNATKNMAKFWGKLGSNGYAILLGFNRFMDKFMKLIGKEQISLSKRVMNEFNKRFVQIDEFEKMIAEIAIEKKYAHVICGHIHKPQMKEFKNEHGSTVYLNSGDWVENMTSLEYYNNEWHIYTHVAKEKSPIKKVEKQDTDVITNDVLYYIHSLKAE